MILIVFDLQLLNISVDRMQEVLDLIQVRLCDALIFLHFPLELSNDILHSHLELTLQQIHFVKDNFDGLNQFLVAEFEIFVVNRHVKTGLREFVKWVNAIVVEQGQVHVILV